MKETIRAVHDLEVENFIRSLGLINDLYEGRLRCAACDEPITVESFGALTRVENKMVFSCKKPSCYMDFVLKARKKE